METKIRLEKGEWITFNVSARILGTDQNVRFYINYCENTHRLEVSLTSKSDRCRTIRVDGKTFEEEVRKRVAELVEDIAQDLGKDIAEAVVNKLLPDKSKDTVE